MRFFGLFRAKKKSIFLLEILIGLSLMALLLSFLFHSIFHIAKMETSLHRAREHLFSRQYLQMRIQDLLLGASEEKPPYTRVFEGEKKESLVLFFDQGIDPDPLFSGKVWARLYLDEDKNVSLLISGEKERQRKEILLSNVDSLQFEFFSQKKDDPSYGWQPHWPMEKKQFPIGIRCHIVKQGKSILFAFLLPSFTFPSYKRSS